MPASPLIIRNCPAPRRASSSTELAAAWAPSGSEDVAVFWDTAFGVQARVEMA
jgi:hypothetical protein